MLISVFEVITEPPTPTTATHTPGYLMSTAVKSRFAGLSTFLILAEAVFKVGLKT